MRSALMSMVAPKSLRLRVVEALVARDEMGAVELLKKGTDDEDVGDMDQEVISMLGLPLLHAACALDFGGVVEALVNRGADVERPLERDSGRTKRGDRPLHICARYDAARAASALKRADTEAVNGEGRTVWGLARDAGNHKVLQVVGVAEEKEETVDALRRENELLREALAKLAVEVTTPQQVTKQRRAVTAGAVLAGPPKHHSSVLRACGETARALASPASKSRRVREVMDALCVVKKENTEVLERLTKRLQGDSTLLNARAYKCAHAYDGATAMHAAASKGQVHVVEKLLDLGLQPTVVDPYGRTPLHLAAENGHVDVVAVLKKAVEKETGSTPVGDDAPTDLAGRTPLAWASDRVKDVTKRGLVEDLLFAQGDPAILPTPQKTGVKRRETNVAASSAPGFRIAMEDAHVVDSVSGYGLCGVFDGHGGALCAALAAEQIKAKLQVELQQNNDASSALPAALLALDKDLAAHPRLKLAKSRTAPRFADDKDDSFQWRAEDDSGSTALVALLGPTSVVVACLGDSRAAVILDNKGSFVFENLHTPTTDAADRVTSWCRLREDGRLEIENPNVNLGVARALGDFYFKRPLDRDAEIDHLNGPVSARADVKTLDRVGLLVLASDGLWDVLTPTDVATYLRQHHPNLFSVREEDDDVDRLEAAAHGLVAAAVQARSRDNVTVILINLALQAANGSTPILPPTQLFRDDTTPTTEPPSSA